MEKSHLTKSQRQAAEKVFDWMAHGMPNAVNETEPSDRQEQPIGVALPPHERGCGQAHPIRGTNHEDLAEWCMGHET